MSVPVSGVKAGTSGFGDPWVVALFVASLILRVYVASTQPYIHDEENNAIPLAETISFAPGSLNLPLRGENHGALPAYIVKISGTLFGESPLGYRMLHVALGLGTLVFVYVMTRQWGGLGAARWATALLSFNEYFLPVTARATAHAPFLFLLAAAAYAFSRFLGTARPGCLFVSGAAVGLAFYCKETSVLLLPAFFLTIAASDLRGWLGRPHVYAAAALCALLVAPDMYWNLSTSPDETMVNYGDQPALQAHYSSHLRRIGGVGFSPYPLVFYGRAAVMPAYAALTGTTPVDDLPEYASMNPGLGLLLLAAVVTTTVAGTGRSRQGLFLLFFFWLVFGLFSVIQPGNPPGRLSPINWNWVEPTMLAAVVMAGTRISALEGRWRWPVRGAVVALLLYAVVAVVTSAR